jgi:hypothetical protein
VAVRTSAQAPKVRLRSGTGRPTSAGTREKVTGDEQGDAQREAAQLRYELARLRDRRTVRAALAVTEVRRAGLGAAVAALRGRAPRLDIPGPANLPLHPTYPHLRVLHTGTGRLVASTVPHERLTPANAGVLLDRDRPDIVLVDGTDGWSGADLTDLRDATRTRGVTLVTLGADPAAAVPDADLRVAESGPVPGADLTIGAVVDVRHWSPVGLRQTTDPDARTDADHLSPAAARQQPVLGITDLARFGLRHCLEVMAAGAVVVTGPDARLRAALQGSGAEDEVLVDAPGSIPSQVTRLQADHDLRQRVSVRLRRHIQRHHSTRSALIAIVTQLGLDGPPPERISVLLPTRRPERLEQVVRDIAAQREVDVELLLLPHGDAPIPERLPGVSRVERVDGSRPLGAVLNAGLDLATGAYCAKVDDDDRYGRDHLGDQLLAMHYTGAHLLGRRVHGVYDEHRDVTHQPSPQGEETFEDHLPGGTLLLPMTTMRTVRWRNVPKGVDRELVRAVHLEGGSAYSAHRFGYVRVRHGDHTYDPDLAWSGEPSPGLDTTLLEA